MKKITLLAALLLVAISYGQTETTHLINGDFEAGTYNYVNKSKANNWKAMVKTESGKPAPVIETFAVEPEVGYNGSNGLHVKIKSSNGVGKPNIRLESILKKNNILPSIKVEAESVAIAFTIKFKIKFLKAIGNTFQIQSSFSDSDKKKVAASKISSSIGGANINESKGGNLRAGKANITAKGLEINVWHDVVVSYEFSEVKEISKQLSLNLFMGRIPEGVDFYLDNITQEIKAIK